jgi:hypothetical protein
MAMVGLLDFFSIADHQYIRCRRDILAEGAPVPLAFFA